MNTTETKMMTTSQNKRSTVVTRTLHAIALLLAMSAPALGQGTLAPNLVFTALDTAGASISGAKMCTYEAGTSTAASTWSDEDLTALNANPIVADGAGRMTIFLRPGTSLKFVLRNPGTSPLECTTGSIIWTRDFVSAIPSSNINFDVTGTAGEAILAGDAVYFSDSSGGRTPGSWYKADADLTYASVEAIAIGVAPSAITSGETGTIRLSGLVTVTGPLTPSTPYFASGTAGAYTATAPALVRYLGAGYTATSILVSPANSYKIPTLNSANILNAIQLNGLACGRLTLETGVPVSTTDQTAKTTVYYTPAGQCNSIGLYTTGSIWAARTFAELSIAVPATTVTAYDVFAYDNAGVVALELSAAWNNSGAGTSARHAAGTFATTLPKQDGVWVKSTNGTALDATRRYLGSFRTTAVSGQTEDSFAKRLVWNVANQVPRELRVLDATNSWNYSTATWRQANAAGVGTANQLEFLIGVAGIALEAEVHGAALNSVATVAVAVAIGLDSTTAPTTGNIGLGVYTTSTEVVGFGSTLRVYPAIGYHFGAWLEKDITGGGGGTTSWFGDNGAATEYQTGISARVMG